MLIIKAPILHPFVDPWLIPCCSRKVCLEEASYLHLWPEPESLSNPQFKGTLKGTINRKPQNPLESLKEPLNKP